ncbi:MAG: hypothetical protein JXA74_00015 [Anaerolineae bacterium]|nr:hypothetical protein [Anaerolineae bacterium]
MDWDERDGDGDGMTGRWSARVALLLLLLAAVSGAYPFSLRAATPIRVGLVVVFPDHTLVECVEVVAEDPKGADVLRAAGLRLVTDSSFGLGEAVCKIEATGCDYPAQQCFCECMGATCAYWNYWYWEGADWVHSPMGASNRSVADGAIEAWVWGSDQDRPPALDTLSGLCEQPTPTPTETPPPTETLVPTDTWTPTTTPSATLSPSPSLTPEPSLTPTPSETPTPTLSPTATSSSVPSATVEPSATQVTATPTRTLTPTRSPTPTRTLPPPTATSTAWSAYPYGTATTGASADSSSTPWSAYPLTTATRTRTRSATPRPSLAATNTPRPTTADVTATSTPAGPAAAGMPTARADALDVLGARAAERELPHGYPAPPALQVPPREASAARAPDAASGSAEMGGRLSGGLSQSGDSSQAGEPSHGVLEPARPATPDRVAMVLATSVAQAQASPVPSPPPERQPKRQYGAFVALALLLSLLTLYAGQVRRQQAWRRTRE